MIKNYFKIAWRSLLKNKITGFINICGLGIGMAVALMIGLWILDEVNFNKYHKNYDRLGQFYMHQTYNGEVITWGAVSLPGRVVLEDQFSEYFENISLASWNLQHILQFDKKQLMKRGMYVEDVFPEMMTLEMIAGVSEEALKEPRSIVLSEKLAKSLFGAKNPMGKTVKLDTEEDLQVTGVYKDIPGNNTFADVDFLLPWSLYSIMQPWVKEYAETNWGEHSFQMFGQLTPTADFESVSKKIINIEKVHNPEINPEYLIFPMSKWHLYSEFENGLNIGGRIQYVWLFGIIGVFVLILACINFMNLSTARSERRAKEVGIRKTIGSQRHQLIWQFLSESTMVAFIGLFLALGLVTISLDWFNEISGKELKLPLDNVAFWALMLGFTGFTGLLAGSYPAFYLSAFKPIKVLKGKLQVGKWAKLPRQILVTLQFTVSIALIIGTMVVYQQIQYAKNRPLGYKQQNLIHFMNNAELNKKPDLVCDEVRKTGVAEEVSYSFSPVTSIWSSSSGFSWEGKDESIAMIFGKVDCSPEYGRTIGWNIKEGRDFSRERGTDSLAMILNEAATRQIGFTDMIGREITFMERDYQVIGVVEDIVMESPWEPIKPTVFMLDPNRINVFNVKLKSEIPVQDAIAAIKTTIKKLSPSSPFEYRFADATYARKFRAEERIGTLAYVFSFLAIFISCLGLFGLSVFVAERRTKEIGIRKVLGASIANLWAMQSRGFVIMVIISCLIATPLAWYFLENWLANYDYRIEISWQVFISATALALLVTLLTVSYQSVRAAMTNPVKSLKNE